MLGSIHHLVESMIRQRVGGWLIVNSVRLGLSASVHHSVRHFDVWLLADEVGSDAALATLAAALDLIATHDSPRFARMQREMPRIWIGRNASADGAYLHALNLCILQLDYVRDSQTTPSDLALVLVHEAMHARLRGQAAALPPRYRIRVERLCKQAEIAFAKRLPASRALLVQARRDQAAAHEIWSAERWRRRHTRLLRERGVPQWLVRLILPAGRGGNSTA